MAPDLTAALEPAPALSDDHSGDAAELPPEPLP